MSERANRLERQWFSSNFQILANERKFPIQTFMSKSNKNHHITSPLACIRMPSVGADNKLKSLLSSELLGSVCYSYQQLALTHASTGCNTCFWTILNLSRYVFLLKCLNCCPLTIFHNWVHVFFYISDPFWIDFFNITQWLIEKGTELFRQ